MGGKIALSTSAGKGLGESEGKQTTRMRKRLDGGTQEKKAESGSKGSHFAIIWRTLFKEKRGSRTVNFEQFLMTLQRKTEWCKNWQFAKPAKPVEEDQPILEKANTRIAGSINQTSVHITKRKKVRH